MFSTDGCTFPETFYLGWFSKKRTFFVICFLFNIFWLNEGTTFFLFFFSIFLTYSMIQVQKKHGKLYLALFEIHVLRVIFQFKKPLQQLLTCLPIMQKHFTSLVQLTNNSIPHLLHLQRILLKKDIPLKKIAFLFV